MEPSYPLVLSEDRVVVGLQPPALSPHRSGFFVFCHFKANDMFESTCSGTAFAGDDGPAWPVQCIWKSDRALGVVVGESCGALSLFFLHL